MLNPKLKPLLYITLNSTLPEFFAMTTLILFTVIYRADLFQRLGEHA